MVLLFSNHQVVRNENNIKAISVLTITLRNNSITYFYNPNIQYYVEKSTIAMD